MVKVVKNLDNKGNGKGFNQGSIPEAFGPDDAPNVSKEKKNSIGGTSEPNMDKNKIYDAKLLKPKDPALNAVAMPNHDKGNTKDYGMFNKISDYPTNVGGTPRPNKIS